MAMVLFARFRSIWPQRWDEQFESNAMLSAALDEWAAVLVELSVDQVECGVAGVRRRCDWLPSIAKFVDYATQDDKLTGAGYCTFVALPRPVQSSEVVRDALQGMRERLRGGRYGG
jgi:hypothetical protein